MKQRGSRRNVVANERAVEQINGAKAETATFLFSLRVKFQLACCRFPPRSSQSFDGFAVITDGNLYERFREIFAGTSIVR